jgi:hypothetical protein
MPRLLASATTLTLHGNSLTVTHAHQTTHVSTVAIALAVLGALVVCGCLAWAIARTLTLEPRWILALRHASAEAGLRASATWAEFSDWARLGR